MALSVWVEIHNIARAIIQTGRVSFFGEVGLEGWV